MDVVDHEGHPIQLGLGAVWYWIWLAYQIAKCNLEVAWLIVSPSRTADPRMVRLHASQHSAVGQVMYANSITLTPGTVTVELQQSELLVHALTPEAAEDLEAGAMDRRATAVEI
jgi:multicomponent Na+:H+ antiporter subunit E